MFFPQKVTSPAVIVVTCVLHVQVAPPGDDSLPEDAAAAGADVALFIELWRADLLMAAAEVAEPGCSIVRAESGLGLVFGVDHARLLHHKLNQ
jgi:hypothetical protein